MRRMSFAILLAVAVFGLGPDVAGAVDIETQARAIEGKLMAPCCMANTVAEHHSGAALEMRQEIRQMLSQGQNSDQILAHYAAEHGEQILAMPAAEGFNLVVWLVPLILLIVGPVVILLVLRRSTGKVEAPADEPLAPIDPEYAARLQRRLAELD
jgi:cytochrome c-type biogenesis protein CcmH